MNDERVVGDSLRRHMGARDQGLVAHDSPSIAGRCAAVWSSPPLRWFQVMVEVHVEHRVDMAGPPVPAGVIGDLLGYDARPYGGPHVEMRLLSQPHRRQALPRRLKVLRR